MPYIPSGTGAPIFEQLCREHVAAGMAHPICPQATPARMSHGDTREQSEPRSGQPGVPDAVTPEAGSAGTDSPAVESGDVESWAGEVTVGDVPVGEVMVGEVMVGEVAVGEVAESEPAAAQPAAQTLPAEAQPDAETVRETEPTVPAGHAAVPAGQAAEAQHPAQVPAQSRSSSPSQRGAHAARAVRAPRERVA